MLRLMLALMLGVMSPFNAVGRHRMTTANVLRDAAAHRKA